MPLGISKTTKAYLWAENTHFLTEPKVGRVVVFLDGARVGGKPPKGGAAAVQVKGVGQETEVVIDKVVYGAASYGEVQTVAVIVGGLGEDGLVRVRRVVPRCHSCLWCGGPVVTALPGRSGGVLKACGRRWWACVSC